MNEEVFSITKNPVRAKALKDMAEERLIDIKKEDKAYKILEQYYEIIKELITAIMYLDGFKTLSHKTLIFYLETNYKKHFNRDEFFLIDETRRLRNDILYYGRKVSRDFLINKESQLKIIITKLVKINNEKPNQH